MQSITVKPDFFFKLNQKPCFAVRRPGASGEPSPPRADILTSWFDPPPHPHTQIFVFLFLSVERNHSEERPSGLLKPPDL